MQQKLIRSATVLQHLLCSICSTFRVMNPQVAETLFLLSFGHLFGLYNPNQLASALRIPKSRLYRHLTELSPDQWKRVLIEIAGTMAIEHIRDTESKSDATKSRHRITISVDDTVLARYGKHLSYCYRWWSKKQNAAIWSQNVLAITIKIGVRIFPLNIRLVGKQGRGNTDKPSCLVSMIDEVLKFFDTKEVNLRAYPITFDSWYGSHSLIESLTGRGFESILIHGKNNYVMTIDKKCAKLSVHKKSVTLCENQWGCNKPVYRARAVSGTFGSLVVLFFSDMGQMRTMLVFGKSLRCAEILKIWGQHHGIEQFWRLMKSNMKLSEMSLSSRRGASASVGVKVLGYLVLVNMRVSTGRSFHQIQMELSGQRELFGAIMAHFHEHDTGEYG